jgi:GMP reductase
MNISKDIKLDFNDVLIKPKKSMLKSRSEVNLIREFNFPNTNQIWKGVPILSSNMDTIGTVSMYHSLKEFNMMTCFHKFLDEYPENDRNLYSISIGIHENDFNKLKCLYEKSPEKCNIVCIDVANGYMN